MRLSAQRREDMVRKESMMFASRPSSDYSYWSGYNASVYQHGSGPPPPRLGWAQGAPLSGPQAMQMLHPPPGPLYPGGPLVSGYGTGQDGWGGAVVPEGGGQYGGGMGYAPSVPGYGCGGPVPGSSALAPYGGPDPGYSAPAPYSGPVPGSSAPGTYGSPVGGFSGPEHSDPVPGPSALGYGGPGRSDVSGWDQMVAVMKARNVDPAEIMEMMTGGDRSIGN